MEGQGGKGGPRETGVRDQGGGSGPLPPTITLGLTAGPWGTESPNTRCGWVVGGCCTPRAHEVPRAEGVVLSQCG